MSITVYAIFDERGFALECDSITVTFDTEEEATDFLNGECKAQGPIDGYTVGMYHTYEAQEIRDLAGNLYVGGWRAEDAGAIEDYYHVTKAVAYAIADALDEIADDEAADREEEEYLDAHAKAREAEWDAYEAFKEDGYQ